MANIANNSFRSRLAQNVAHRVGPQGFHHNPQDFSERCGSTLATRQSIIKDNWEYLPARLLAKANSLSTSYRGVAIDKNNQFQLGLA